MASNFFVTSVIEQFRSASIEVTDDHLVVRDQETVNKVKALMSEGRPVSLIIASPVQTQSTLESADTTTGPLSRNPNLMGC